MFSINWICGAVFLGLVILFAVLWIKAEMKLVRHGASKLFQEEIQSKEKKE